MRMPIHENPLSLPDLQSPPLPTIVEQAPGQRTWIEIEDESGFPIGSYWSSPITERIVQVIIE